MSELYEESMEYASKAYESSENKEDSDDWNRDFRDERKYYIEDNCEKLSERNRDRSSNLKDKENDYFEVPDEKK